MQWLDRWINKTPKRQTAVLAATALGAYGALIGTEPATPEQQHARQVQEAAVARQEAVTAQTYLNQLAALDKLIGDHIGSVQDTRSFLALNKLHGKISIRAAKVNIEHADSVATFVKALPAGMTLTRKYVQYKEALVQLEQELRSASQTAEPEFRSFYPGLADKLGKIIQNLR